MAPTTRRRLSQLAALLLLEAGVGAGLALWDPTPSQVAGWGQGVLITAGLLLWTLLPLGLLTVVALWIVDVLHGRRGPAA